MSSVSRRTAVKTLASASALAGLRPADNVSAQPVGDAKEPFIAGQWSKRHDRVWLGNDVWANPMEDWRIVDGAAECRVTGGNRNIQSLTHQVTNPDGMIWMSVKLSQVQVLKTDGGAGFRIGVRSDINEFRANCFAKGGWRAGIQGDSLVLGPKSQKLDSRADMKHLLLQLHGEPSGDGVKLTLTAASSETGDIYGTIRNTLPKNAIIGNVALVNNFLQKPPRGQGARYQFSDWEIDGDAFTVTESHKFGPILWSQYSLSDSRSDEGFVMKMSAITGPFGDRDNHTVELQIEKDGEWKSLGNAELDQDAWVATFRIPEWDEKTSTPYRLVYREKLTDGSEIKSDWKGTVKANPSGRPLRLAGLTCQNDYGFPYEPVANNVVKLDPDMMYFSGDQLYENHGGYGVIRDDADLAILNFLRKQYQHGWSFREAMKDRPTLLLPDDHDVFHGNIWGESGKKMAAGSTSSAAGYRQPAKMVNVVHKHNCAHHPDFYDPTPVKQDISVYYGDMVYGDVSFAVIGDRQFKSGPERVDTGGGRQDHVTDPNVDMRAMDKPGLILLGKRQELFLKKWAGDWRGHSMKVLLSETVFAGVATHHGGYNGYLRADLDCNSWPQTPRNRAIDILREAMPLHINGDQHLTTLVQYGVKEQRDSFWSFCTPAIAAGYPRWWRPDDMNIPHENRPKHGLANTGEFTDSFGNYAYVYAVGNPEVQSEKNRYARAHQKGSGFGLITIDTETKTYQIESFRFLVDATDGKASNQFPGWPVTIQQKENRGENVVG